MPTKHARLNVVVEKPLYHTVASLAKEAGVSLSMKARDLLREAIERLEDLALSNVVESRAKQPARLLPLKELEAKLKKPKK